jgi:hypothetical protein
VSHPNEPVLPCRHVGSGVPARSGSRRRVLGRRQSGSDVGAEAGRWDRSGGAVWALVAGACADRGSSVWGWRLPPFALLGGGDEVGDGLRGDRGCQMGRRAARFTSCTS